MNNLHDTLELYVANGAVPGAVGVAARGDRIEVRRRLGRPPRPRPMARDSIFRLASITKPITAAAVMLLIEDGRLALDEPVDEWLPELASRRSSAHP